MRSRTLPLLLACICASSAIATKTTMRATYAGNDAGTNTFETADPDTLLSTTDFAINGTKMTGTLTVRTDKGLLVGFHLEEKLGEAEIDSDLDGAKLTFSAGGNTKTEELRVKPVAALASFHPQTLRTLLAA